MKKRYLPVLFMIILFLAGCKRGKEVRVIKTKRGEIRESFSEPAKTRLSKTWRITMPVAGRIARIDLDPGDLVKSGQSLATFDLVPFEQNVKEARAAVTELEGQIKVNEYDKLEQTALIETRAAIDATKEALKAVDAQIEAEEARSDRASKELERKKELARSDAISQSELEDYLLDAETALIELRKQEFVRAAMNAIFTIYKLGPQFVNEWLGRKSLEREVLVHQLTQAESRLVRAGHELKLTEVRSPIDGVILEKYEQGDSSLPAGRSLLLLGSLDDLEVVVEVLTQDALRISEGSKVDFESPALERAIPGKVKRIEPAGFTKLSSLGVEQQRVNVIIAFLEKPEGLGVGYRLQARFLTGSKKNALIVPRFSVLQEPDGAFYVFQIDRDVLKKNPVHIGLKSDLELEVTEGLGEGDLIVAAPDSTMKEGLKVLVKDR